MPFLLAIGFALAACGASGGGTVGTVAATGAPKHGGTLTVGVNNEIAGWSPQMLRDTTFGEDRGNFVYDTLLKLDAKGDWQPNLATSMTTSDSVTWTMKLRPGVTFTDGTPLDAAAVKFNVGLTKDPSLGSSALLTVSDIKAITVLDPATVQFVLGGPDGSFPYAFTSMAGMMVSPTAYQADPRGFAQHPVGAGPFMLQSWTRDSQAVLVRNPHYWDVGRPYLDKVVFQVITDPVTLGQSLASGEIDVAANGPAVQATLKGTPGIHVVNTSLTGGAGIVPNESRAPFDDVRIRKAIALAIDPRAVNASLFQGAWSGSLPCAPYAPNLPECAQGLWPKTDLAEAKKLVADYVAEKGPLKDHYELLGVPFNQDQAQYLQQVLASIGIHVTLNLLQTADYNTQFAVKNDFDLAWSANTPFAGPARGFFRNLYSKPAGGRHVQGGPVDPALESLLNQATKAVDRNSRVAAVKKIEQLNATQFLYIWFGPYISGFIAKDDVEMPASFTACAYTRAADIWLDR